MPYQNRSVLARQRNLLFIALFCLLLQRYTSALLLSTALHNFIKATKKRFLFCINKPPRLPVVETGAVRLLYLCFFKRSRNYLRGFLIAA